MYAFPRLSLTELTLEVVSFHPTTTIFKLPAVCATPRVTGTDALAVCGVAALICTKCDGSPAGTGGVGVAVVQGATLSIGIGHYDAGCHLPRVPEWSL